MIAFGSMTFRVLDMSDPIIRGARHSSVSSPCEHWDAERRDFFDHGSGKITILRHCKKRNKRKHTTMAHLVSLRSVASKSLRGVAAQHRRTLSSSTSGFDTVGVIGLGLMGHGICQVAAASGIHSSVVAFEKEQRFLDSGKDRIMKSIDKMVAKEKISAEKAGQTLNSITWTTDMDALKNVDFIVEAVIENMDLKRDLYTDLGGLCKPGTIFASNTSSLSITEMAAFSGREDKFVGIHFFNPVQLMKLVEVIRTEKTDPAVFEKAYNWVGDIGKVAVSCGDTPGFIVNRLLVPSLMQALLMVDRRDATVKDIDISMQLGAGHPMVSSQISKGFLDQ